MEWITKKDFYRIPRDYRGIFEDYRGKSPEFAGRRTAMLHGCVSEVEGVHFMVIDDYTHLPVLTVQNAKSGYYYKGPGNSYILVLERYKVTDQFAKDSKLNFLDRVKTNIGNFALVGGK